MSQRLDYYKLSPDAAGKYIELTQLLNKKPFLAEVGHLVTLRASQINGCAFCVDMHVKEARIQGSVSCVCTTSRSGVSRRCSRLASVRRWNGPKH